MLNTLKLNLVFFNTTKFSATRSIFTPSKFFLLISSSRRSSYFEGQRRRSTIRRMSSLAYTNESFEKDSVISEGTDSVFSGIYVCNVLEN